MHLSLPKGLQDLVMQGLDKIGQHRPGACLNERLYGHSGQKLEALKACNFLHGRGNMDEIVSRTALLILDDIAGDPDHAPVDLRSRSLVEGGEPKHCRLADDQLINVLWWQLHLDGEFVSLRHD